MKGFDTYLIDTRDQRRMLLSRIIQKVNEESANNLLSEDAIAISKSTSVSMNDASLYASLTLSIFRGEMAIYHEWMSEQFSSLLQSTDEKSLEDPPLVADQTTE